MLNVPNVFTQGAMKALVQAQISAASMGHEKMGSGHLLCGLCRVGDELTRCILGDLTARGYFRIRRHFAFCAAAAGEKWVFPA